MWQVIGASVVGTSHIRSDLPCQDAHGYALSADGLLLAAVADGLGTAARADEGARLAVEDVLTHLQAALTVGVPDDEAGWRDLFGEAFGAARAALAAAAQAADLPLRDYATTLLVLVAGDDFAASAHVGDGAIVVADGGDVRTLSAPEQGEYANQVLPLTAVDALDRLRVAFLPRPVQSAALLSDGLQSLALNLAAGEPFAPFFRPFFKAVGQLPDPGVTGEQLAAFLASDRVNARTDDDKTLLVAGRVPPPQTGDEDSTEDETAEVTAAGA